MDVTFKLDVFEGPLDLLLHLIAKHKVSVDDIPITEILDQYLAYLEAMQSLRLEITSEFIVMAAHLILIKSKMLLPKPEEEPAEDPRTELVRRLTEYKLIKAAAAALAERLAKTGERNVKPPEPPPANTQPYLLRHDPSELLDYWTELLLRPHAAPPHRPPELTAVVRRRTESVEDAAVRVMQLIRRSGHLSLSAILASVQDRSAAVAAFLAVLELCRDSRLYLDDADVLTVREDTGSEAAETPEEVYC